MVAMTIGYTVLVAVGLFLLIKVGKPSRFPVLLPIGILITYPIIWYVTFKDIKDAFYNRPEEDKFVDIEEIWTAYKNNKSAITNNSLSAYGFFTNHSKFFIFVVLVLILVVLVSK